MPNDPEDIRNLWQNQPVEHIVMQIEEIRRTAAQFETVISQRNRREYIAGAAGIAMFAVILLISGNPVVRTGSALIIAGGLFVMYQLYKRARPDTLPEDLALTASLQFRRRELVRQRDLLRSAWLWYLGPIVPGVVVFVMGVTPRHGAALWLSLLPLLCFFGWLIRANYREAKALDRQVAEIEKLESQS